MSLIVGLQLATALPSQKVYYTLTFKVNWLLYFVFKLINLTSLNFCCIIYTFYG